MTSSQPVRCPSAGLPGCRPVAPLPGQAADSGPVKPPAERVILVLNPSTRGFTCLSRQLLDHTGRLEDAHFAHQVLLR